MSERTTANENRGSNVAVESTRRPADASRTVRWGASLIGLSGVGFVANGIAMLYRALFSDGFEAGVHALGGVTRSELAATNPAMLSYIDHLHVNVAGLMVAAGIGILALSWYGVRRGQRWALATTIAIPVVFLVHSLPVHQTAGFSFDALLHLGPGAIWLPLLIVGAVLASRGLRSVERRPNG